MVEQIKEIKVRVRGIKIYSFLLVLLFMSCVANNKRVNYRKSLKFAFSSLIHKDSLTLKANDSIYFLNELVITSEELGVSSLVLRIQEPVVNLSMKFTGVFDPEFVNRRRTVTMDTILYRKKGKYIFIQARLDKIELYQFKKKFVFD